MITRIHQIADRHAAERPDAPALIDHDGRRFTWADFRDAVDAAEAALRAAGLRGGDRLLILNENCAALIAFLMAASRLDAWAVLVNARLSAAEIDRIAEHATPRVIVGTDGVSAEAGAHAARFGALRRDHPAYGAASVAGHRPAEAEPVFADGARQVAALLYTSGTTGTPKGVMLSHANVLFIARVSGALRALSPDDLVYAVLPVSHVFGLSSTCLGTLYAGGALMLVPRFTPEALADALAGGVTVFQGVPAMYAKLVGHLDAAGLPLRAPRLRYLSAGGAPLDIDWKRRVEARLGAVLNNGYGLTECAPTVSQTRIEDPRSDDSIGPPLPGVEVKIAGARAAGEVGEMLVRGPTLMLGYYRDPAATAAAIDAEGFFHTGDLGRYDADGNLFLVGRCKELIIRSGFNVYPPEIETALNACPGVLMAAVIGRPVDGNEEIVAFVEAAPGSGVTTAGLRAFLAGRLAPYKRPQHVFIVDQMPAAATGKIQKHRLLPLAEAMIAAR